MFDSALWMALWQGRQTRTPCALSQALAQVEPGTSLSPPFKVRRKLPSLDPTGVRLLWNEVVKGSPHVALAQVTRAVVHLGFLGRLLRGCLRVGEELDRPHNALEVLFLDHEPGILD
eukprot:CAMPEP_0172592446 /NCGR_PEP_ID=MMETSP1068-20121228/11415_1 /TAXON_ID=35684 /ORGANISM="Pseudopedinella elastica, Strain CCMP716" /LENGTH=116 /DNA_ID=CAMNT_0013389435 /DNA_START=235 /DNA_END=584 /DNA_ORIENTATION=-